MKGKEANISTDVKGKWKTKKFFVCGIVLYLVYAVLTGGIGVKWEQTFETSQKVFPESDDQGVNVKIWGSTTDWSIPFVTHYYYWGGPYRLRLQVFDETETYSKVSVTNIVARFDNGDEAISKPSWEREFYETPWGWGVTRSIPNVFDRHANVTIEMDGTLEQKDGAVIPFKVKKRFVRESEFSFATFWERIAAHARA